MKIRQAKKIMHSKHWSAKLKRLRPPYIKKNGMWVYPSWHDITNPTFQKARRTYKRYWNRYSYEKYSIGQWRTANDVKILFLY